MILLSEKINSIIYDCQTVLLSCILYVIREWVCLAIECEGFLSRISSNVPIEFLRYYS